MKTTYLFGKKALEDAINNHLDLHVVYLTQNQQQLIARLKQLNINYQIKPKAFLDSLVKDKKSQDVVFVVDTPNKPISLNELLQKLANQPKVLILMLDEIQDLGNLGAILRTANGFGVDAVIYKKDHQADPFNEVVIKTSTNAVSYLTLCETANLSLAIDKLKKSGFWIYVSCLDKNSSSYHTQNYPDKSVIVVGNEYKGVSSLVIKNSDIKIHIPQCGQVQSLNVSVATGILLADYRLKQNRG